MFYWQFSKVFKTPVLLDTMCTHKQLNNLLNLTDCKQLFLCEATNC